MLATVSPGQAKVLVQCASCGRSSVNVMGITLWFLGSCLSAGPGFAGGGMEGGCRGGAGGAGVGGGGRGGGGGGGAGGGGGGGVLGGRAAEDTGSLPEAGFEAHA